MIQNLPLYVTVPTCPTKVVLIRITFLGFGSSWKHHTVDYVFCFGLICINPRLLTCVDVTQFLMQRHSISYVILADIDASISLSYLMYTRHTKTHVDSHYKSLQDLEISFATQHHGHSLNMSIPYHTSCLISSTLPLISSTLSCLTAIIYFIFLILALSSLDFRTDLVHLSTYVIRSTRENFATVVYLRGNFCSLRIASSA